jgi:hypothetical protein
MDIYFINPKGFHSSAYLPSVQNAQSWGLKNHSPFISSPKSYFYTTCVYQKIVSTEMKILIKISFSGDQENNY